METAFWKDIELRHEQELPLYKQLSDYVERFVDEGILKPGTRLPSERKWAEYLNVSRMTITLANEDMKQKGIVRSQPGSGTFITRGPRLGRSNNTTDWQSHFSLDLNRLNPGLDTIMTEERNQHLIQLSRGDIHSAVHPGKEIGRRMISCLNDGADLLYSQIPIEGDCKFRRTMSRWLVERNIYCSAKEVMVVSETRQALDLISRLFLGPGDYVVMEEPGHQPASDIFYASGAEILRITLDGEGMKLNNLEQLIMNFPIKFIYLNPTFQNPTGITMSKRRRVDLIALAEKYNILLIEDDSTGLLYYDKKPDAPLKALDKDNSIIYISSLSNYLYPEIQLAVVVAQEGMISNLAKIKRRIDPSSNLLTQAAIECYMSEGEMERHLHRLRDVYKEKLTYVRTVLSECDALSFQIPEGGIHVWCKLENGLSAEKLLKLVQPSISFVPGNWLSGTGMFENYFRLTITSPSLEQLKEGLARIVAIINKGNTHKLLID